MPNAFEGTPDSVRGSSPICRRQSALMLIGRIHGATRVLGKSQGYLGLPLRDEVRNTTVDGERTPAMVTAREPTPDELNGEQGR